MQFLSNYRKFVSIHSHTYGYALAMFIFLLLSKLMTFLIRGCGHHKTFLEKKFKADLRQESNLFIWATDRGKLSVWIEQVESVLALFFQLLKRQLLPNVTFQQFF